MKKVFFGGFILFAMTMMSCKKNYVCTWYIGDTEFNKEYNDYDKDQAEAAEAACDLIEGTFAER